MERDAHNWTRNQSYRKYGDRKVLQARIQLMKVGRTVHQPTNTHILYVV